MRADYQTDFNQQYGRRDSNFDWNQIYAYRALPMQAARLTLGETYLNSPVFDAYRFTGLNLASDERMLPPNLQGYAPEVRGIAKATRGSPSLRKAARCIKPRCPPGRSPFRISAARYAANWM
ncbi:fimbria/pilus outer membrane usher protein [Serratia ureilytica]